jgi:membrane protease YdiL (CAAX protease family)
MESSSDRRPLLWLIFFLSALTAIAWFFIPAFIIQPFKHQTAAGIAWAMAIRQRAPWGTLVAAFVSLVLALGLWRGSLGSDNLGSHKWRNWGRKTVLTLVMLPVLFSAVMARINYFEWMFHPVENLRFDVQAASKLDQGEMILAVRFGDDARAYPISQMAYHHVVNDVVGGVPIAVTY